MKTLQVVPYFPPAYAFGGPVKVAYQISRELVNRGHKVVVYTSNAKDSGSRLSINSIKVVDGIKVHYFRNLTMMSVEKSRLFITPQIVSRAMEEVEVFDVVHLHEYRTLQNIVVAHYAKKHGVPYVLQAHGSLPRIMTKQRLKWIYDVFFGYRLLRDASKVIALSQTEAQQYRSVGVSEKKIEVIPNGIELSEYANLSPKGSFYQKFDISKDKKIILYLGRIHKTKGIDFLVKAYAYMIKKMKNDDAILVIAGPDDGYLDKVKQLASSLKVADKVVFTGMLLEKEKISAYVDSSICTYLRPYEPFGLVPLEAAACGTPSVVSAGTYMGNVVNKGKFGFSVKYSDIFELAEIMKKMLNNDGLLKEMGEKGRKSVFEKFNWPNIVTKVEKVYEAVTGAK